MTYSLKILVIAISAVALTACSTEADKETSSATAKKTVEVAAKAPPPKVEGPNYCYGQEHNPDKPFRFVYFNLPNQKNEMKRIRGKVKTDLAALKELPAEKQPKAFKAHFAKTQVLAALAIQTLADQIQSVSATLCNFEIYEKDQCTGLFSRSVRNADMIDGTLVYTAPDGRGQDARVSFASQDYSDITIEGQNGTSKWSRTKDGVESFSLINADTETRWTENPDCSGQLTRRQKNSTVEATWTSPKAAALTIDYNYCSKGECFEGTL